MPASPELVAPAATPLARVRRIFLALALVACTLAAVTVAGVPDRTAGLRIAGVVAIAALAAVWARAYRRGALSPLDEPIELAALFAVGLAAGSAGSLGVVYTGLYLQSMYGSRTRAAAGLAVYAVAHVAAVAESGGQLGPALAQLPPLAIGCAVMQAFAAMLERHERSLQREAILRDASAGLVAAGERASVYAALLRAVARLGGARPPAAVVATLRGGELVVDAASGPWLPGVVSAHLAAGTLCRDETYAIASPRLAGLELFAPPDLAALAGVCVPLSARGALRGALVVFGDGAGREEIGALTALSGEAALALAALDAADGAVADRSIARLTERVAGMI